MMSEMTLYKFMPIGPFFRLNLLQLLEKSALFFARSEYLNDPLDCKPNLSSEIEDHALQNAVSEAIQQVPEYLSLHSELLDVKSAIDENISKGRNYDAPHGNRGLLTGTSYQEKSTTLLGFPPQSLREITKMC
jgi:hypothetical protein